MNWISAALSYAIHDWVELAGFAATAFGIWLTARRVLWCWPVVLAADVLYLAVFFQARLFSDALLQIVFLGFTLYGWWHWWRGVREQGEVRVEPLGRASLMMGLTAGVAGCAALGVLTVRLGAALPFLDAALASFSLVASWWQARKHTESWWLWIVVDTIYIGEYVYKKLWPTAVLYAVLVVLAAMGLRDWRRAAARD